MTNYFPTFGSIPATTASVILNSPDDWWKWIDQIKSLAISHGVWEYVNPDSVVRIPGPPIPLTYSYLDAKATSMQDLIDKGLADEWRESVRQYNIYREDYCSITAGRVAVCDAIRSSIARIHLFAIHGKYTEREMLQALRQRFQPNDTIRKNTEREMLQLLRQRSRPDEFMTRRLLKDQFFKLIGGPKRAGMKVENWLLEWEHFANESEHAAVFEYTGDLAVISFLEAVESVDPIHARIRERGFSDIYTEIRLFREEWTRRRNRNNTFATFQSQSDSPSEKPRRARDKCPCGERHLFTGCPYVIESLRLADWKPDPDIIDLFKRLRRNPRMDSAMKRAVDEVAKKKMKGKRYQETK